ncbi:MAG: 2,3-diphosphoglycerate synthetase [Candidatus Krumholzibacteriia bacterium]
MRALALIDGEHYPPVVRQALEHLHETEGLDFVAAVFLGGTEKLVAPQVLDTFGLPVVQEPVLLRGVERGLAEYHPDVVVDLSDEPITGYCERFSYACAALAAGAAYRGADFEFRPPRYERVSTKPSLAVYGTGKRIGKTAISAYLARFLRDHALPPVVVAMGRGGPAKPEVIDGSSNLLDAATLLEFSRAGRHASSDHFENALLSRILAVGARRCGSGLAGVPYVSNVIEAGRVAHRLDSACLLFDGSGAAIPPVAVDRRVLVMGAHQPLETLRGFFGPYRIRIADVVLITMCESPLADERRVRVIRELVSAVQPRAHVMETVFRPRPCFAEPLRGRRAVVALTSPETMGPVLVDHLERTTGVRVVGRTHALSNRQRLREDLHAGLAARPDVVLTELKAASIDVVAEAAEAAGLPAGFLDNVPVCRDEQTSFEGWLETALELETLRQRAALGARGGP